MSSAPTAVPAPGAPGRRSLPRTAALSMACRGRGNGGTAAGLRPAGRQERCAQEAPSSGVLATDQRGPLDWARQRTRLG